MKLLIISSNFPYPLFSGGNTAQYQLVDKLRNEIDITLISPSASEKDVDALKKMWNNVDIRVFDVKKEEPKNIKKELFGYIKHPLRLMRKIIQVCENIKRKKYISIWPDRSKMMYLSFNKPYLYRDFVNYVYDVSHNEKFDIVQVEFIPLISLVNILPANVKKIFVHHEIAFVCGEREIKTLKNNDVYDSFMANISKTYELQCLNKYNAIITFSEIDKKRLEEYLTLDIYVSPFAIGTYEMFDLKEYNLDSLVYLGGEEHYPNKDAVEWFINEISEKIFAEFPCLSLKIIGKWSKETIEKYKNNSKIIFLGFVENLTEEMKNAALIVPLRIGSGIRTKILEAFAMGIPVIASTIGIEGIVAQDKKHFFRADSIVEYSDSIRFLTLDKEMIQKMCYDVKNDIVFKYTIDECSKQRVLVYKSLQKETN